MNTPEPAKNGPDSDEGSTLHRYFMRAIGRGLPKHEAAEIALEQAHARLAQLKSASEAPSLLILDAIWNYGVCATSARKLSLALNAYQEILQRANPKVSAEAGYFGGALQRSLNLLLVEGSIGEFSDLIEQTRDDRKHLHKSDRCCVSLLCAGRDLLAEKNIEARWHLLDSKVLLNQLSQEELREVLPWMRHIFSHFENNGVDMKAILPIVEDTLAIIQRRGTQFQSGEYIAYHLESARLHCLTGDHDKSYGAVLELRHALECHTLSDVTTEVRLRKSLGYILGKLCHFGEALEETNAAIDLVCEHDDFASRAALHLQRIDILYHMGRVPEALESLSALRSETEGALPRRLLSAIRREETDVMLDEFAAARHAHRGEEFVQLVDVYSAVLCAELFTKSSTLQSLKEFQGYQRVVEFIDQQLKIEDRAQKILIEEGLLVIRQRADDYSSLRARLEKEYPLIQEGTFLHSKASWLLAIVTLRDEIDNVQNDSLNVEEYVRWGESGIEAHVRAKRSLATASLLSLKGQFYFELGAIDVSVDAHEKALDAVSEGGFLYTQVGYDIVSTLLDICERTDRRGAVRRYREIFNDIEGKLSKGQ